MPKKLGVNTKAADAKARKESTKKAKEELIQKQKEDELWKDEVVNTNKKMDKQNERERKRQELLQKKAENKAAYEQELSAIESTNKTTNNKSKITRSQIENFTSKKNDENAPFKKEVSHLEITIEENVNRMKIEGDEARNVDEAITILSSSDPEVDRHPERRMKAAYSAFEERNLPRLKSENSNLRLSQLKQMLKKEWMKSPENPFNQQSLLFNTKV